MSLPILMDVHVSIDITRALRRRGIDVLTAQEDGAATLPDPALLDRAEALGRILFSRDRDLVIEAVRRERAGERFATLVYAHQRWVSTGRCIDDLEFIALTSTEEERCGLLHRLPL